jgi:hypothetical protein
MHQLQQTSRHLDYMLTENTRIAQDVLQLNNRPSDPLAASQAINQRLYRRANEIALRIGTVVPNPQSPNGDIIIVMMTEWQLHNRRQEGELDEFYQMRSHLEALRAFAAWLNQEQAWLRNQRQILWQARGGAP